jgi:P4 family phage/plasmid primase-like protien
MKFKLSINTTMINKDNPAKPGWKNAEFTLDEFSNHIRRGYAYCGGVIKDGAGTKKPESADISHAQLLSIDIDNEKKIYNHETKSYDKYKKEISDGYLPFDIAAADPFVVENALLIYTSPSHTSEWHRFRIVFLLPNTIHDIVEWSEIASAFIKKFDSDKSCKNIDRFYYGHTFCEMHIYGNQLSLKVLQQVLRAEEKENREITRYKKSGMNGDISPDIVAEMLTYIPKRMDYNDWGKIVSAVGNTFDENTAVRLIESWSPDERFGTRYKIQHRDRRPTIASVIAIASQHGFDKSKIYNRHGKTLVTPSGKLINKDSKVTQYPYTDLGNCERLVDAYGSRLKFNNTSKSWLIWSGKYWKTDEKNYIIQLAKKTVRKMYDEAKNIEDTTKRNELIKHAVKSESHAQIMDMIRLARAEPQISSIQSEFDKDNYLLNLQNGVYNLKTNEFNTHDPKLMLTRCAGIEYEEDAHCYLFEDSLFTIFDDNLELIEYVQRALGLTLCGAHLEEILFFCHGSGKNGKSVFFQIMKMVFGDYFQKAPTEMLMLKQQEGIPNDIAQLPGARLVVAEELPENRSLNENKIKNLTGGDTISARFLHRDYFTFQPTHTLWIYGNHKPIIKGTDEGIWRRISMIPFTVTIPESKRRPQYELMKDFELEKNGIFQWILKGWREYQRIGLNPPDIVQNAIKTYRSEQDGLGEFVEECCEIGCTTDNITAPELWTKYLEWCKASATVPYTKKKFYARVENIQGVVLGKGRGNVKVFIGIKLNNEHTQQTEAF